jgi:predicted RNase H-like nuclease (RuvC/YqgF family)
MTSLTLNERSHEQSLQEIEKLRQQLELKLSDEKKHMYKVESANDEINEYKKTIRKMKQDIAELHGSNNALEKSNVQIRHELHERKMINDDNNIKNALKYEELDNQYKQYKNHNDNDINEYISEITSLKASNQQKQDLLSKYEIKYNTDIAMYKKKLDDVTKYYEEKVTSNTSALNKEKDTVTSLKKQLSSLSADNDQLKMTLDNVNLYIDGLMTDDNSGKAITVENIDTTTTAASATSSSSSSSSHYNTVEAVEVGDYPIDDTDQLLTNFNQTYSGTNIIIGVNIIIIIIIIIIIMNRIWSRLDHTNAFYTACLMRRKAVALFRQHGFYKRGSKV